MDELRLPYHFRGHARALVSESGANPRPGPCVAHILGIGIRYTVTENPGGVFTV